MNNPIASITDGNYHGRTREGLDPKSVSIEQLNLAIDLLYQASFGLNTILRGEFVPYVGKVKSTHATFHAKELGDALHVDFTNPDVSTEELIAAGIFLGRLHDSAKSSMLAVGGTIKDGRALLIPTKEKLAQGLNGLAKKMGKISLSSAPDTPMLAIECLTKINAMRQAAIE